MRTLVTWTCVILGVGVGGLAVSQALSLERWVDSSRLAVPPALAQETRPPASPVLRSRFARPVPAGWSAPRLAEEPGHPGEALLTRLRLPSAHAADVALPPVAGLSLVEAPSVGPWPRPIPVAASVMQYRPALGQAVSSGDCAEVPGGRRPLGSTIADKMPDQCDDKLWGRWICGQTYDSGGKGHGGVQTTLSRTIGEGGYEHIRYHVYNDAWIGGYDNTYEWKVDEKWHPAPLEKGKLAAATCNGWNKRGYRILTVYYKKPDGSDREALEYFVDSSGRLWKETYEVWFEGDKMHQKFVVSSGCVRET